MVELDVSWFNKSALVLGIGEPDNGVPLFVEESIIIVAGIDVVDWVLYTVEFVVVPRIGWTLSTSLCAQYDLDANKLDSNIRRNKRRSDGHLEKKKI